MSEKQILVRQLRSAIGRNKRAHGALEALGLGRIGREKVLPKTPAILAALRKLGHLVGVKELS